MGQIGQSGRKPADGGRDVEVLKIGSKSSPNACAGALAGVIRSRGAVEVQVIGAGALNQAVKAVAIARGFLDEAGIDLICVPTFADIEIDGAGRTAVRLLVEDRHQRLPATLDIREEPTSGSVDGHRDMDHAQALPFGGDGRSKASD